MLFITIVHKYAVKGKLPVLKKNHLGNLMPNYSQILEEKYHQTRF